MNAGSMLFPGHIQVALCRQRQKDPSVGFDGVLSYVHPKAFNADIVHRPVLYEFP